MPKSQPPPSASAGARAVSVAAGEFAQPDITASLVCLSCGDTMLHRRTIPKLDAHPELLVLACPSCQHVEIMADNRRGVRATQPHVAAIN
jgi:hypothetical protein